MAMELYDLQVSTSNIHNKLNELGNSLQKETKQNRIEEIVKMMEDPSFWLDRHLSSSLIKGFGKALPDDTYETRKIICCANKFKNSNILHLVNHISLFYDVVFNFCQSIKKEPYGS